MILWSYFKKLGGFRMIHRYAKYGVLGDMLKVVIKSPFNRYAYKRAYSVALKMIEPLLVDEFSPIMLSKKSFYGSLELEHHRSDIIWFCWLQGLETAPTIVKACYHSLKRHLADKIIREINEKNWNDYVTLPEFILEKRSKGQIPTPHFTDMLRLQLLIQYGGTWIDSTVLCTGFTPQNENQSRSFLDADLFLFQYTHPGSSVWGGIGNWFISACTNNEVLMVLRDMLFAYWHNYDCLIDYFIFHLFFSMLRDVYPETIAAMPYGYAQRSIGLGYHLGDKFNADIWEKLTANVAFHKLTYNVRKEVALGVDNYYRHIIAEEDKL